MRRMLTFFLALLGLASVGGTLRAGNYGIEDNAHTFSPGAIAEADDLIRQIRTGDNRDVMVLTYTTIPDDKLAELAIKKNKLFFADWADELAQHNHVNGILILLTFGPERRQLEVNVGNKTKLESFTLVNRGELIRVMLPNLKMNKFDDALLDGLHYLKRELDQHPAKGVASNNASITPYPSASPSAASPSIPTSGGMGAGMFVCLGVVILLAVFLIMGLANRNRNSGYGAAPGNYPSNPGSYPQQGANYGGGGGGSGFGRGFLGGLLGGAIGSWGYDRLTRPDNTAPPQPYPGQDNSGSDQTDTSYSAAGADFGPADQSPPPGPEGDFSADSSSSSGSDLGGGDSGGGGDSSSGGDF